MPTEWTVILVSTDKSNKNSRKLVSRVQLKKEKTGWCAAERRKETIKKRKEKKGKREELAQSRHD